MQTQPETGAVAQAQEASSSISSNWRWVLYATAGVALVLALKYFHVQDLLKAALDWIGKLGPWGPVIFVGLYVVATVLFVPGSVLTPWGQDSLPVQIASRRARQNSSSCLRFL